MVHLDLASARPEELAHGARHRSPADTIPTVVGERVPRVDQTLVGAPQIRAQHRRARASTRRDPFGACFDARVHHTHLAASRGLDHPAHGVGVAGQVRDHLGARPPGQPGRLGRLLVGEIVERAQDLPRRPADQLDLRRRSLHAPEGRRPAPSPS